MRQGMNNESILVEYTLYLITDQSLVSSILMIFCTTMQTYFQFQLLLYHPQTFLCSLILSRYSSPDAFSQIENEYVEFTEKFKNICLIGDFNARTAEDDEFITLDENTLFETFDGFIENAPNLLQQLNLPLKRNNVDKGKNPYDNLLLNLCRGNDLFIVNGRIGDNKEGNFEMQA
jgi:hypothetical protein